MSTKIEWTDETWNPIAGCSKVSPGCDNCYAIRDATRLAANPNRKISSVYEGTTADGDWTGQINFVDFRLDQPLRWTRPRRIFVNSMSDLFHPELDYRRIREVFNVMRTCNGMVTANGRQMPSHTFQVLTKRPQRMADLATNGSLGYDPGDPPGNVWLGTSIESNRYAYRAEHLRRTPAAVRFLSLEPLLGPLPDLDLTGIDWVIVGGESGPGARPMHPDWVRSIRNRCQNYGVPFHFKQRGEWTWDAPIGVAPRVWLRTTGEMVHSKSDMHAGLSYLPVWKVGKKQAGRDLDGRTWDEYPT